MIFVQILAQQGDTFHLTVQTAKGIQQSLRDQRQILRILHLDLLPDRDSFFEIARRSSLSVRIACWTG